MPSSNFLRHRWTLYLVLAIVLGAVSPAIGRLFDFADPASRHGMVYWWFMGIPAAVDMLVWPPERYQPLLWAAVFTVQYYAVFAAGAGLVILQQRRDLKPRRPSWPRPEQQRAFDTAAATYSTRDGW